MFLKEAYKQGEGGTKGSLNFSKEINEFLSKKMELGLFQTNFADCLSDEKN